MCQATDFLDTIMAAGLPQPTPARLQSVEFYLVELEYEPPMRRAVIRHLAGGGAVEACKWLDEAEFEAVRDLLGAEG